MKSMKLFTAMNVSVSFVVAPSALMSCEQRDKKGTTAFPVWDNETTKSEFR